MSKHDNEITFNDMWGSVWGSWPIINAKSYKSEYHNEQKEKYGRMTFADCPGIIDYYNTGWLLLAWAEIEIYTDDDGHSMVYYASRDKGGEWPKTVNKCPHRSAANELYMKAAVEMDKRISDGIPRNSAPNGQPLSPLHITTPWGVHAKEESVLVLPPYYHGDVTEHLNIFPGIVDYDPGFSALNLIFSVRKPGTYKIKAGTPLMHIVPLKKTNWKAYYQHDENGKILFYKSERSLIKQWYRRLLQRKHTYSIERFDNK